METPLKSFKVVKPKGKTKCCGPSIILENSIIPLHSDAQNKNCMPSMIF
jgi:hypothetical protein